MNTWIPCYSADATLEVGSKKVTVPVEVYYELETESVEGSFDFGDERENADYLARFQSGELLAIVVRVRASYLGEEGVDYLGQCHVRAAHLDADVAQTVEDHGMVTNALAELQANLITRLEQYKALAAEAGI